MDPRNFENRSTPMALMVEAQQCCTGVTCPLDWAPQSHTNYDTKAVKAPCHCHLDGFEPLTLFNKVFIAWTCTPLSYFFLVLCSLTPRTLKRSLNMF